MSVSAFDDLSGRLLSLLGLDFDLSLDLLDAPLHPIRADLFLGSRPRPEQAAALEELGITHVVSCLAESERPAVAFLKDDFETLFLPVRDGMNEDLAATFAGFFAFLDRAGSGAKALVHCEVGVSRSASLVIARVMQTERARFYEAYRAVRAHRPQVLPNVGFASQLQRFEHALFPEPRSESYCSLARYLKEVCHVPAEIGVLQAMLEQHDHDALRAIRAIFGDEVPRVVQGVRR